MSGEVTWQITGSTLSENKLLSQTGKLSSARIRPSTSISLLTIQLADPTTTLPSITSIDGIQDVFAAIRCYCHAAGRCACSASFYRDYHRAP